AGPAMASARSAHTATTLEDGRVAIAGGNDSGSIEIYDPAANSFSTLDASLQSPRSNHGAALLSNGKVFVAGGTAPDGSNVLSGEVIDIAGGSVSAVSNTAVDEHNRPLLRVLPDGKVQIIGGNSHGTMEVYDPAIDTIGAYAHVVPETDPCAGLLSYVLAAQTRSARIFTGSSAADGNRSGFTVTELGNKAIVIGGTDSNGNALSS